MIEFRIGFHVSLEIGAIHRLVNRIEHCHSTFLELFN